MIVHNRHYRSAFAAVLGLITFGKSSAQELDPMGDDWMDIDELATVRIVSVSKTTEESIRRTSAAVHVVTADDIRRSGATSIPESLRWIPGVEVGRIGASQWAVGIRGFADVFNSKLLVLMDGRSVYTPSFAGTYWGVQDTLLQDIEQIEVVRGPGGTVWGANAVNGVINIRTKSAKDTVGSLVTTTTGTEEEAIFGVRHGLELADNLYLRLYGKYRRHDGSYAQASVFPVARPESEYGDDYEIGRGGFRLDWEPDSPHRLTLQTDFYDGYMGAETVVPTLGPPPGNPLVPQRIGVRGRNVLARWNSTLEDECELYLQAYYDEWERHALLFEQKTHTVDLDTQFTKPLGERHRLAVGLGYRGLWHEVPPGYAVTAAPASDFFNLFTSFLRDDIQFLDDRVKLTLGSKFEHNDFSGFEIQPSARLSWEVDERNVVWGAISRAVRTPSLVDTDFTVLQSALPPITQFGGGRGVDAEDLMAYELGWRGRASRRLDLDAALYYNDYEDLIFGRTSVGPPPIAIVRGNFGEGESYGAELGGTYRVRENWRFRLNYTIMKLDFRTAPGSMVTAARQEGASPFHRVGMQSLVTLFDDIDLDLGVRYVDNVAQASAFWTADARLAWRPRKHVELAVTGKNLFQPRRTEFAGNGDGGFTRQIERSVMASLTVSF